VGCVLPYFFIGIGYYYQGMLDDYLQMLQMLYYPKPLLMLDLNLGQMAMLIYILLLAIAGYLVMLSDMELKVIKIRRLVHILGGYLLLVVLATPFVTGSRMLYLQLISIPAAVFIARLFDRERPGLVRSLLLFILVGGAIGFQLFYFNIL
jgi:hypothetical protein